MHINIFLFGMIIASLMLVSAKRISALINEFCLQSLCLSLLTFCLAFTSGNAELYLIAAVLFLLKVVLVPFFLRRIVRKIKVEEGLGLFLNPMLSLLLTLGCIYLAYLFTIRIIGARSASEGLIFIISISIIMAGLLLMIFRMKALAQIIGLLVIENGIFLLAESISGGMPFFVEIAIFFDVFVSVAILGVFVYRINRLFTHIDVNKLSGLKG